MRSKSAGWGEQTSSRQVPEVFDDERPFMAITVRAVSNMIIASSSHLTDRSESRSGIDRSEKWSFRDGIGTSAATRTTMVLLRSCADDDYVADDGEDCRSIFTTNKELERRIGYGESDLFRSPTLRAEPKSSLADTLAIISRQRDISTQARLIGPLPVDCLFDA
ncbi:hypothetical protein BDP67DRAFT_491649 [Colletotrichum lupini]|nr:hypothetical protein BDP67DRAFT_491649 [Colletotrichum lupini]